MCFVICLNYMDNLVTIYHGGAVEYDRYGYVEFVDMQSVPVLFNVSVFRVNANE